MQALLLALALAVSAHASEPTPLHLSDVESAVWSKNPSLQAARAAADEMRAQARAEGAWEDPQLSFEWMELRWPDPVLSEAGRRRLELVQTLPLFGQAGARGRTAAHAADRARAQAIIEGARLVYEAKLAYWQAQEAAQMLRAQARAQEALAALRKVSAQRGRFGRLDRMGQLMDAMLERELAGDEAMGLEWQAQSRNARYELERLMAKDGEPALVSAELAEPDTAGLLAPAWSVDELWQKAQRQDPELQEAIHHVRHAGAALDEARLEWLPQLMLEGGLEESQGMDEATLKAGINVPWLWFSKPWGRNRAAQDELLQARAMAQDSRLMLQAQCRQLASELELSQAELRLSLERILPAAERGLQAAVSGYSSGDLNPRESMDAVMGYLKAQEDYAQRLKSVGSTLAAIDRLMAAPAMEISHE